MRSVAHDAVLERVNEAARRRESHDRERQFSVPAVRFQLNTFYLLGVRVDNINGTLARRIIQYYIEHNDETRARKVFFTNVHSICTAHWDWIARQCINTGDLVLADGSGMKIGGILTKNPIRENLNGTDFTPTILKMAQAKNWSVYFLGAKREVVNKCCNNVRRMYPDITIAGFHEGYFTPDDEEEILNQVNAAHPDILLVALGTPLQEKWITQYAPRLNVKVCMAVGGLFDFLSHTYKRAPRWMRSTGIEWLYRFLMDPRAKWNRILVEIPMFFSLFVVKQFFPQSVRRIIKKIFSLP